MSELKAILRQIQTRQIQQEAQLKALFSGEGQAQSPQDVLDALPGRRIFYNLTGSQEFTSTQEGFRADPISFTISQDGPWVATHYPVVLWKPNAPTTATNRGRWSPVSSWPMPVQDNDNLDIIDLSYEFFDGGSQRAFNNEPALPIFSSPTDLIELPQHTLFAPNSNIQFFATFESINFSQVAAVPTTGGKLVVTIPGYRIVNS